MKNILGFLKKIILFVIIICLLIALSYFGKMAFMDIQASVAKEYLVARYGLDSKELTAIKSTEYVYEDIANCETLWLKKCSDDKNLHYIHVFKLKDGTEIEVTEYVDRTFIDNYNGKVVNEEPEKHETGTNEETN